MVTAKVVTITPELAEALLAKNTRNRTVVTNRVDQYAADMRRGNWIVNGEAIKVAHTGEVLDGQHRLLAILEADAAIETLLITGLEPEAQETMDAGRPRKLYEALKIRGEKEYVALGSALKLVTVYERDRVPFVDILKSAPSNHGCFRTLDRNPSIRDSVTLAAKHKVRWFPYSALAGLHYLFGCVDPDDADDFIIKLTRGADLKAASLSQKAKLALVIRTWNAYRRGEDLVRLTWGGGRNPDTFPRIEGLIQPDADDQEDVADAA